MTEGGSIEFTPWVDLYWLPLGAGAAVPIVHWNGLLFEAFASRREHRPACDLYHAGLEVGTGAGRFVIEMAPAWGTGSAAAQVATAGPVGFRWLGRSRFFRYQVRCWRDGVIPDARFAVDSPRRLSTDLSTARRIVDLASSFPTGTWGRDEFGTGEMWNSNSLVAWLLARSGVDMSSTSPPPRGRAPGWTAGLIVADRQAEA
jgi:hypothetical protein